MNGHLKQCATTGSFAGNQRMTQSIWRAACSGHFCALYLMDVRTALLGIEIVLSIEEMIKEGQV